MPSHKYAYRSWIHLSPTKLLVTGCNRQPNAQQQGHFPWKQNKYIMQKWHGRWQGSSASSPTSSSWTGRLNTVEMTNRGRLQVHNQAASSSCCHEEITHSELCLQILPAYLVPPHAASPATAIRLFLFVKRVLRRSCWRSGLDYVTPIFLWIAVPVSRYVSDTAIRRRYGIGEISGK